MHKLTLAIALAVGTVAAPSLHAAPAADLAMEIAGEPSRALYREGHAAIEQQDWARALERFRALEREQRKAKEPADAALYWQAYALVQLKRTEEAATRAQLLLEKYPDSPWADDARALATDTRRAERAAENPSAARGEDVLMALDALMASGRSERAVPLLQKVLQGNHSDKVKSRAMFVLSQYDTDATNAALATILAGNASTKLKKEAIHMVAAGGRRESVDRIVGMYWNTNDADIREAIIEACVIAGRGDLLRTVAKSETNAKLRERAIHSMGAVGDRDGLAALFNEVDDAGKLDVLQGLGIAGARTQLQRIVHGDASPNVRAEALRQVGVSGGRGAGDAIADVYRSTPDAKLKRAAIDGLIICGCASHLSALYATETDRELKRKLLQAVAASGSDEAIELIDDVLSQ
jgi:tetratricopeptide (TPR) repeat protein